MLDVFRDSGFAIRSKTAEGCVDVYLSLAPSSDGAAASDERDRFATIASLRAILEPRAIAVIGASRDDANLGRRIFDALHTCSVPVYPVNPAVTEIHGLPCYPSARELPPGVDLAVIAVPREAVPGVVDDCAAAGVKGIVVISAGFAESGDEGRALQARLVERVRSYGMRMVGPNCMGVLNASGSTQFNASFAPEAFRSGATSRWRRRAAASALPFSSWRLDARSGCPHLSVWATRPTCRATTCSNTRKRIRPRQSSFCIWNPSATRAASRVWPAASPVRNRS